MKNNTVVVEQAEQPYGTIYACVLGNQPCCVQWSLVFVKCVRIAALVSLVYGWIGTSLYA